MSAAERRLRAELDVREREARRLERLQDSARHQRLQDLLGNVAVLGLAACATLAPPVLLARLAPLVRTAPTVLAGFGVWRVGQRIAARWGDAMLDRLGQIVTPTLRAASWAGAAPGARL